MRGVFCRSFGQRIILREREKELTTTGRSQSLLLYRTGAPLGEEEACRFPTAHFFSRRYLRGCFCSAQFFRGSVIAWALPRRKTTSASDIQPPPATHVSLFHTDEFEYLPLTFVAYPWSKSSTFPSACNPAGYLLAMAQSMDTLGGPLRPLGIQTTTRHPAGQPAPTQQVSSCHR